MAEFHVVLKLLFKRSKLHAALCPKTVTEVCGMPFQGGDRLVAYFTGTLQGT